MPPGSCSFRMWGFTKRTQVRSKRRGVCSGPPVPLSAPTPSYPVRHLMGRVGRRSRGGRKGFDPYRPDLRFATSAPFQGHASVPEGMSLSRLFEQSFNQALHFGVAQLLACRY